MKFEALIFDLDGTLIDSEKLWQKWQPEFLAGLIEEFDKKDNLVFIGRDENWIFNFLQKKYKLNFSREELRKIRVKEAIKKVYNQVDFMSGADDFIKFIYKKNIKMGIGTAGQKDWIDCVRNKFNLDKYFDAFVSANEVVKSKPEPDIFLLVAKKLNVKPQNCLVFEDTALGIESGKRSGMNVWAFGNEGKNKQNLSAANRIFDKWSDLY